MGSDDAGNGAVVVFEIVTVALRTHKVLACVKLLVLAHFCHVIRRSTDRLTEIGTWGRPSLNDCQASLAAHQTDILLTILVRVEPINFLSAGDDAVVLR